MKAFNFLIVLLTFVFIQIPSAHSKNAAEKTKLDSTQTASKLSKVKFQFVKNGQLVEEMSFFTLTKNYFSKVNLEEKTQNVSIELLPEAMAQNVSMDDYYEELPTIVIDLQTGSSWNTFNEIAIPNTQNGSMISGGNTEGVGNLRLYLSWIISKNHSLRLLYAPFRKSSLILPTQDLLFNGVNFMAGNYTNLTYKFNSYRLSYIYQFDQVGDFVFRMGFTAKIRDAEIGLASVENNTSYGNVGFAPLLHFGVRYDISERLYADLDMDGSWSPRGSALDASVKIGLEISEYLDATFGYRFLGGGADSERAYNFAAISTVFFGFTMYL